MRQSAGRFAPSPTGPLHYGSLLAATASFLDARSLGQQWLLRIDDLDTHRNLPGAEAAITTSLERHGLLWDGPVLHQRERIERYEAALAVYPGFHYARRNLAVLCDLYLDDLACARDNYEAYLATVHSDDEASLWLRNVRFRMDQ